MDEEERRGFQRLRLRLPISELSATAGRTCAEGLWTRNISSGGMCFEIPAEDAPQDGAELTFELSVPPGEGYAASASRIRGAGRVVRRVARGKKNVAVAVHFAQPLTLSLPK